jgi:serine protease
MKMPSCRRPEWACLLTLAAVIAAVALPAGAVERGPARQASSTTQVGTEARVIVKYKADSNLMRALSATATATVNGPQHATALSARLGLALADGRAIGPRTQVVTGAGLGSAQLAAQLSAQSDVEYAVVDGRKRALDVSINDPLYLNAMDAQSPAAGQWYLQAPGSTFVAAINAPAAWAITTGKSSVVVADLDTGVRFDHPDLTNKLLPGRSFVSKDGTSQAGWSADASDPGDFTTTTNQCGDGAMPTGSSWHGTQTAGVIGAETNNGIGMASAGHDVMVQPLRVLGTCGGYDSDIQAAMLWAAGINVPGLPANPSPARVINMSLGSSGTCSTAYQDTVNQLAAASPPVVVVVAAGNDGLAIGTPANCTGVIAVAGVRHTGTKVGYSDLGPNVTISAPAGNCVNATGSCLYPILTTGNSGTTTPVLGAAGATYTSGGVDASLGTSFSAPQVTGTVALMLSANASLTPAQVTSALQSTASPFPSSGAAPIQLGTNGPPVPVAACQAPTSTAQNYECYCTTSTCGAGTLDAGAATTTAQAIHASISPASASVVAGNAVKLDGSGSWPSGVAIGGLTYQWALTGSAGAANLKDSTSTIATVQTAAAGAVQVTLTVTDSTGAQATSTVPLSISAVPVTPTPSGGGGGGAMQLGWLLGWLASVIGVWVVTPRRRRG